MVRLVVCECGEWVCASLRRTRTGNIPSASSRENGSAQMLYWSLVFFVVAIMAAILGFGGIAAGASQTAKTLFFVFIVLFVLSLLAGLFRRGTPPA